MPLEHLECGRQPHAQDRGAEKRTVNLLYSTTRVVKATRSAVSHAAVSLRWRPSSESSVCPVLPEKSGGLGVQPASQALLCEYEGVVLHRGRALRLRQQPPKEEAARKDRSMRPVNGTAMAVPVSRVTSPPAEAVGSTRVMHPHMHRMRLVLRSGPTSSTSGRVTLHRTTRVAAWA